MSSPNRIAALAILLWPAIALSDLWGKDPETLCSLLAPFGLEMTEFVAVQDEGRPLCFVIKQPASAKDDGYEFSYRVIAHRTRDLPHSLFLEISGLGSVILGREPQRQFTKMARVVLSDIYPEKIVSEIILAIESMSSSYNQHVIRNGMQIQLRAHDYSQHGYPDSIDMRFDVSNV